MNQQQRILDFMKWRQKNASKKYLTYIFLVGNRDNCLIFTFILKIKKKKTTFLYSCNKVSSFMNELLSKNKAKRNGDR